MCHKYFDSYHIPCMRAKLYFTIQHYIAPLSLTYVLLGELEGGVLPVDVEPGRVCVYMIECIV